MGVNYGEWLRRGDEVQVEPVSWLLDDFFARKHVTWIWGEPSSGKTLFVQMIFLNQANQVGVEWHHHENGEGLFNLFYIAGHDTSLELLIEREELVNRNRAVIYNQKPMSFDITVERERKWFIEFVKGMPEQVDAICFDTADNFALASDSNDTRAAVLQMNAFREVAVACNLAVILIGHSNKSGQGLQGNVKRLGGADHVWRIMSGQNDVYLLQREKYRVTVHRHLSEIKLKFVKGLGFVLTDEPFESKKNARELNFEKAFAKMGNKFSRRDFLIECGTVSARAIHYLNSMIRCGRLQMINDMEYEKNALILSKDNFFLGSQEQAKLEGGKNDLQEPLQFLQEPYPF